MAREWELLLAEACRVGAAPTASMGTAAVFCDSEFRLDYFDAELLLFLERRGGKSELFEYRTLEPKRAVNVIHYGGYDFLNEAYAFAYMWADRSGHLPVGQPMEHYHVGPATKKPESEFVTELYIPIE